MKANTTEVAPSREKYWSELSVEEKVERMREQIKNLQSQLNRMNTTIDEFLEHKHLNGKIVIPFDRYPKYGEKEQLRRGPGKDDVYF